MIRKALIWIVALAALAAAGGAAYFYQGMGGGERVQGAPPAATPDNNVIAGPVASVGAGSITIMKQDGTSATLSISTETKVVVAGDGGPGAPKKASEIKPGMMVLATPSESDASAAAFIVILPPPPPAQ